MPTTIEALIDRQLRRWEHDRRTTPLRPTILETPSAIQPVITVSRQHGSRGSEIARRLADRFQYTLLHRDIIDRICAGTGYTRRLLEMLDEHARSQVTIWIESMLSGRYLDESDYVVALLKTVRSIAQLGGVIVVGRGANFIIGPQAGVHVRVVAPREERIAALMIRKNLTEADATREVETCDEERVKFIRKLFGRSPDDPLAYDLIVNESGRDLDTLVNLVASVADEKIRRLRSTPAVL
jgi:cytidylate kinase